MAVGNRLDRRQLARMGRRGGARSRTRRCLGYAPVALLVGSSVVLAIACRVLLHHSVSQPVTMDDTWPVYIGIVGFLVGSAAVVVQHGVRLRQRLIGPEQRMRDVLAALRSGDLSPRVHLRGGDLLHGLADDLNHTIEWLNRNPPQGATPGGDVLDVDHHDEIELDESQWDAVVNGGSHARG